MKNILPIVFALIVAIYVIVGRFEMFDGLDKHYDISMDYIYSEQIDLEKMHTFTWVVKSGDWRYEDGVATLLLVFDRQVDASSDKYWEKDFSLKVKVSAHAETENAVTAFRLVTNYFYPTDEPMANHSNLWAGWPNERLEYRLGNIIRFPKEDLIVELTILVPDPVLNEASPHLKLVGDYDPAVLAILPFVRLFRDIGLIVCLFGLLVITRRSLIRVSA